MDVPHTAIPTHYDLLSGWQWSFIRDKMLRAGFIPEDCEFKKISDYQQSDRLVLGMGERVLNHFTDLRGIDKWHLSPLTSKFETKFIPTFDIGRIQKQWELGLYLELALRRAYEESETKNYERPKERFHLNPSVEETFAILDSIKNEPEISIDVETGYGQINTVGFAWSASDAIAINVLPSRCADNTYLELWSRIRQVLTSDSKKIFQNFIYDVSYFSAYGIKVRNIAHDTMWAMKFLWPELDMNLGNVGRLYTKRPYWKDDGKVEGQEGKRKNWGDIRDWTRHYTYNCRDTTGTWEAYHNQLRDIKARGLSDVFHGYLLSLIEPIWEMCSTGIPVCPETRERLRTECETRVLKLSDELKKEVGYEINPGSWQQKLKYLKDQGITIPKKYDKAAGRSRESTDSSSLKKIRLKHPDLRALELFSEIGSLNKALSSYIDFDMKPGETILRYSLNGTGTESLRFSGHRDPWDRGFNIQTIPREGGDVSIKSMFLAPPGWQFLEVDLKQAESRFVAYDSADKTLIEMLDSGADVHRHVAAEIFKISQSDVTKDQRQLGKKAGHGANYAMKETVFIETCFSEMDLTLSRNEARNTLESYHKLFPGIRRWHMGIRSELNIKRKLSAPSGWERYFYGRFGDDMFKEAYAWRPQHTIPWVTNHLMLHLMRERKQRGSKFKLLAQIHDSIILLVPDNELTSIARICLEHKQWHPRIALAGGELWIPVECKSGKRMSELEGLVL